MPDLFNTGIRPAVDDWLLKRAAEKRDYGKYWSASSAGYCQRKNIFDRLGVPPVTEDARKQRVFTAGDIFHQWMQEITKAAGLSIAQELELQDEDLMIRGHIDDLVLIKGEKKPSFTDNEYVPVEIVEHPDHLILYDYKTQNSRAFSYKRDEMSHFHKMQLGTYMYMLRKGIAFIKTSDFDARDLTEARILKISKDDLRMTEEQLLWSEDLEIEVKEYWSSLNDFWERQIMPPCTCADHEIIDNPKNPDHGKGFMASSKYNPYFYKGEPCSLEWYLKWKKESKDEKTST